MKYLLISAVLSFAARESVLGQAAAGAFRIDGIPQQLSWIQPPKSWEYGQKKLVIISGVKTDLFVDPQHDYSVLNSPKAVFDPADTFLLSGMAEVDFKSDYDAGVLVLYAGEDEWAKLCFEYSPQKKPFIVSVVNNGISDDCNHIPVMGNKVYLRIAGLGNHIFVFHYSIDGKYWNLVRYFSLAAKTKVATGFSSQSPTGDSCKTIFSAIRYSEKKLKDIRNGD